MSLRIACAVQASRLENEDFTLKIDGVQAHDRHHVVATSVETDAAFYYKFNIFQ